MSNTNHKKLSANTKAMQILRDCIKQNMPDKQIQACLVKECGYKWAVETISRRRRAMGVVKNSHNEIDVDTSVVDAPILETPPHGVSQGEKAVWFRDQFKKTHIYRTLRKQLEPNEIAVYLEDFGLLCCQFEDVITSEFMQVDDFIKHRILVDRQLILVREVQRQISKLQEWLVLNPRTEGEDQDKTRARANTQQQFEKALQHLKIINDRYDSLVKERQKILKGLAATRQDRLDELRGGKETFLELIGRLQHSSEEREQQGRFAELTRLASEDVKAEFRNPTEFPDGDISPILMDAETNFGEVDDE